MASPRGVSIVSKAVLSLLDGDESRSLSLSPSPFSPSRSLLEVSPPANGRLSVVTPPTLPPPPPQEPNEVTILKATVERLDRERREAASSADDALRRCLLAEGQLASLTAKAEALEAELRREREEAREVMADEAAFLQLQQLVEAQSRHDSVVTASVADSQAQMAGLAEHLAAVQASNGALTAERDANAARIRSLQADLDAANDQLNRALDDVSAAKTRADDFQARLRASDDRRASLERIIDRLKRENSSLDAQASDLRQQLASLSPSRAVASAGAASDQLASVVDAANKVERDLRTRLHAAEGQIEDLKTRVAEAEATALAVSVPASPSVSRSVSPDASKAALLAIPEAPLHIAEVPSTPSHVRSRISQLQRALRDAEASAAKRDIQNSELRQEAVSLREDLEGTNVALSRQRQQLRLAQASAAASKEKADQLRTTVSDLKAAAKADARAKDALQADLRGVNTRLDGLQAKLRDRSAEVVRLRHRCGVLEGDARQGLQVALRQDSVEGLQDIKALREGMRRAKEEWGASLKERSERLELATAAADRLRGQNDALRGALADAHARCAALQQELDVLRSVDVYSATLKRELDATRSHAGQREE